MAARRVADVRRKLRPGRLRRLQARLATRVVRPLRRDGLTDLAHILPASSVRTIIDVGVHAGNLTAAYLAAFPAARVIGIEADARATAGLHDRFADVGRFELIEAAAAGVDGQRRRFYATATGATSSLLTPLDAVARSDATEVEVDTITIDTICRHRNIEVVDLLKVDVEGAEIEVLEGATGLLHASAVRAIYAEARFVRETDGGVVLHELAAFLAGFDYRLHNLYDLVESQARGTIYANALFLGANEEAALAARTNDRIFVQRLARVVHPSA